MLICFLNNYSIHHYSLDTFFQYKIEDIELAKVSWLEMY